MIEKIRKIYYCEYCKKHYHTKRAIEYHEIVCGKKPENYRPCFYCIYNKTIKKDIEFFDDDENLFLYKYRSMYCKSIDRLIYPPFADTSFAETAYEKIIPMPKKCNRFIDKKAIYGDCRYCNMLGDNYSRNCPF
jgi:hypothetical protein